MNKVFMPQLWSDEIRKTFTHTSVLANTLVGAWWLYVPIDEGRGYERINKLQACLFE